MSAVLSFALGLTTTQFLGPLATADSKLKTFLGGMISLGVVIAGVEKQIAKGAALKRLSDQTGETIGNLYKTQRGLRAVGIDSESAGNMIFMLNKALGGVNEQGEPTAFTFAQIGLQIEKLKKLNAPQQLLAIANGLNKLDASSSISAAGKIFGRYNAREFLQLSRNADEFADALRRGGIQAAIFDRYGRSFEKIEILTGELKEKIGAIFLGIAAGIGPALENVMKMLDRIDLSKIGAGIGTFITALTEAFREGKLGEMIGDTLKMGFDSILIYAPAIFEKVGYFLLKAFETPLTYLQARMDYIFAEVFEHGAKGAGRAFLNTAYLGTNIGDKVFGKGLSFEEFFKDRQKEGVKFDLGGGQFDSKGILEDQQRRMAEANKQFSAKWDPYWSTITGLASRAPQPDAVKQAAGQKESLGAVVYTPNRTAIEKMGFVFRGGTGADPATQTARNTSKMVSLLGAIHQRMSGGASGPFADPFLNAPAI